MQKQKRSQKIVTYIISGIFTCILIALGSLLLAIVLPSQADYDAESQATAQYLEQYPAFSPAFIRVNDTCDSVDEHCFWILPDTIIGQVDNPSAMSQRGMSLILRINGRVQPNFRPILIDSSLYGALNLAEFGSGLHLIDIQIEDKDGRIHQHTWSARIDVGEVAPPPTLAVPPTYSTAIPSNEQ